MRIITRVLAALLLALALAACGGDEGGDSGYVDLLRFVPDTDEARERVVLGDFARVREIAGVDRPPPGLSDEEEFEYIERLFTAVEEQGLSAGQLLRLEYFGMSSDYVGMASQTSRDWFGIGLADLDRFASVRPLGSSRRDSATLSVMQGRFDVDGMTETFERCGACPLAEAEEHAGWATYSWTHGGGLAPTIGPERRLEREGGPLDIALGNGRVLRTTNTSDLHAMIDAHEDGGSLADDEAWRRLAEELDALQVVRGELSSFTPSVEWAAERWGEREAMAEPGEEALFLPDQGIPTLRPYLATGMAIRVEDGEPVVYQFLVHEDASLAEENLALLEERVEAFLDRGWLTTPEFSLFETFEMDTDGELLTLRLFGAPGPLPLQFPLFIHE